MSLIAIEYDETSRRRAEIQVPDDWDEQRIRDAFECFRIGVADSVDDEVFAEQVEAVAVEIDGGYCAGDDIAIAWLTSG